MDPKIITLSEKKLIGKRIITNFRENKTYELWRSFMPRRKEIQNNIGAELYSIEIYPPSFFEPFNPDANFEKWAAIEVTDYKTIPDEMATITIPDGLYAIFIHKGTANDAAKTYGYIFTSWLPNSNFLLDNSAHFALM